MKNKDVARNNVGYIGVTYLDPNQTKLTKTANGDCIDLRVRDVTIINNEETRSVAIKPELEYAEGDIVFVKFGVVLKVPEDKRINIYPRSSTFKNFGLILTNSVAIIDNTYCGNKDEICGMFYALRDGKLSFNDRIAQFEVVDRMMCTNDDIVELQPCEGVSRGGYGTSGVK